mgnify:CR=1 FL=1
MKSTSQKILWLALAGLISNLIFSEPVLSRSEPKEEEVSQTSRIMPNESKLSPVMPQTTMHSRVRRN